MAVREAVRGITRRLPRARDAGRLRQRLLLQRDRRARDPADADGRHGRAHGGRREPRAHAVPPGRRRRGGPRRHAATSSAPRSSCAPCADATRAPAPTWTWTTSAGSWTCSRRWPRRASVASAHDVSDGGLAVALAECAMSEGRGAEIALSDGVRRSALLFGESTGRAVVSFAPELEPEFREAAKAHRFRSRSSAASAAIGSASRSGRDAHRRARRDARSALARPPSRTRSNPPTSCRSCADTPDGDPAAAQRRRRAVRLGIRVSVVVLASTSLSSSSAVGPKIVLDDPRLADAAAFCVLPRRPHDAARWLASGCELSAPSRRAGEGVEVRVGAQQAVVALDLPKVTLPARNEELEALANARAGRSRLR